ncbi:hypothetical protein EMG21_29555, partial [Klebsiella pneumoniae]
MALVDSRYHMEGERDALIAAMRDFKILPAGRHLWASGVEGRQYLFNCLAYETEIVTREGIYPIGDLEGQTIEVRDGNGRWVETVVQSYGVQPLRKVTWSNGKGPKKVVYATGGHRWKVAKHRKGATEFVTTDELKPGYSVAKVDSHRAAWAEKNEGKRNLSRWTVESVEETDRVEEVFCVVVPTTHTFVLADGLLTGNCHVSGWGAEVTDHFEFTFMRLMEGGGVGANYSNS